MRTPCPSTACGLQMNSCCIFDKLAYETINNWWHNAFEAITSSPLVRPEDHFYCGFIKECRWWHIMKGEAETFWLYSVTTLFPLKSGIVLDLNVKSVAFLDMEYLTDNFGIRRKVEGPAALACFAIWVVCRMHGSLKLSCPLVPNNGPKPPI